MDETALHFRRLERSAFRWRLAGIVFAGAAVGSIATLALRRPELTRTRAIEIVDQDGNVRITMLASRDGSSILLTAPDGTQAEMTAKRDSKATVGVHAEGSAVMMIGDDLSGRIVTTDLDDGIVWVSPRE